MPDDHAEYMRQTLRLANRVVRFNPGQIVATPGALVALVFNDIKPMDLVLRHVFGDFGDVSIEDRAANEAAISDGDRILSAYTLADATTIWVITEADRASTCLLTPDDY